IDKQVAISAHTFATPRINRALEYGKRGIWNDKFFVDSDDVAIASANRTRAVRIIEAEKMDVWLQERDSVEFKYSAISDSAVRIEFLQVTDAFSFIESRLHGIGESVIEFFFVFKSDAIDDQQDIFIVERMSVDFVEPDGF